jgi:hypothetical protein
MATTATLGGLSLTTGPYTLSEPLDFGENDLAATLLSGDLRPEEYDQYLAELRYVRQLAIPINIRSGTFAQSITDTQALFKKLSTVSRYSTIDFVFTPNGGNASTFKVIGGSLQLAATNRQVNLGVIRGATLFLDCLPFAYGAAQNLGSSGAPLISNTASPALVTITPNPTGDVPADIILSVKNRGANPARSLIVSTVSGNTTWVPQVDSGSWTLDSPTGPTITTPTGPPTTVLISGTFHINVVNPVAHWTQPTLPTDRRFMVWLRARDNSTASRGTLQFRLRHLTGSNQVIGAWRSIPVDASPNTFQGVKMGSWPFPLGQISKAGAATTTTYLEVLSLQENNAAAGIDFDFALYQPEDSTVIFETEDTSTSLVAAAGTVQVESDVCFSTTGQPAGTVATGAHVRAVGSSQYCVHLSQGFLAGLDSVLQWDSQNVDVYAVVTPRSIGLA